MGKLKEKGSLQIIAGFLIAYLGYKLMTHSLDDVTTTVYNIKGILQAEWWFEGNFFQRINLDMASFSKERITEDLGSPFKSSGEIMYQELLVDKGNAEAIIKYGTDSGKLMDKLYDAGDPFESEFHDPNIGAKEHAKFLGGGLTIAGGIFTSATGLDKNKAD